MTEHNYPFTCLHNARASNEYVMNTRIRFGRTTERPCPRCYKRMLACWERCQASGHKSQTRRQPVALPELQEG